MNPPGLWRSVASGDEDFLRVVGRVRKARIEEAQTAHRIDHVWLTLDTGTPPPIVASVNTSSAKSRAMGFDPRIRTGLIRSTWNKLPARGVFSCEGFSYGALEARHNVYFEHRTRREMEEFLLEVAGGCELVEVWGVPYRRKGHGIHQIHSRAASCAVATSLENRDGALQFYFLENQVSLLVLLKFCGQE